MIPGGFEERARLRRLRLELWRAVWTQRHAYDEEERLRAQSRTVGQLVRSQAWKAANGRGDVVFEDAMQRQWDATDAAEALGFQGDPAWLEPPPQPVPAQAPARSSVSS